MSIRYYKTVTATIANDASESSVIDTGGFKYFGVELPTASVGLASSTVTAYIVGSDDDTGSFRAASLNDIINICSASTGNIIATCDLFVPKFIKVKLSANTATATGYAAKIHMYM